MSLRSALLFKLLLLITLLMIDVEGGWWGRRTTTTKTTIYPDGTITITTTTQNRGGGGCKGLHVVPRADWGAGPSSGIPQRGGLFRTVYIYDVGKHTCNDQKSCVKLLQTIQNNDRKERYGDIKSNFLVGQDAKIYEGRGWDIVGDYKRTGNIRNEHSIGVAFMGDFSRSGPNKASLDAVRAFLTCSDRITTHFDVKTTKGTPISGIIRTWGIQKP